MKTRLPTLAVAAVIAAPLPVLALDEAAVLLRLEQLEAQRRADQAEIDALRRQVEALQRGSGATLSSSEAQLLREEIAAVDQRAASRVGSLRSAVDTERDKLQVNGFMSAYAVKTTDRAVQLGSDAAGGDWDFRTDTIAGVQFTYRVTDRADAVVQLIAEGRDDYELEAGWAFLRYALTPDTTLRAGRLVMPQFLYTETVDVGFTYPWVRPPIEMYGVTTNRYQGIDLTHDVELLGWGTSLQAFVGDNDDSSNATRSKYTAGAAATFTRGHWTVRGSYIVVDEVESDRIADQLPVALPEALQGKVMYSSIGARYDDGRWLAIAEASSYDTSGSLSEDTVLVPGEPAVSFLSPTDSFYGTLGYQLERVMPYVTYARTYTTKDASSVAKWQQESLGVGLRYTLTDKIVLKGEATRYRDFGGTRGTEGFATGPNDGSVERRLDADGVTIMSFGFDAIF